MDIFTLGQGQFNLYETALEVDLKRNHGQAFFPDFGPEPQYFAFMQQELAVTQGFKVVDAGLVIGADMKIADEDLAVLVDQGIAVLEIAAGIAQGLDFRAFEHDPGLKGFHDVIGMAGLAVVADDFDGVTLHGR